MPIACRRTLIAVLALSWMLIAQASDTPRVITLAPHLTELVYAIGAQDQLVGVVEYSDFPAAAQTLPRIGDAFRFDLERILALDATLALAWEDGTPGAAIESLEQLGIEVLQLRTAALADLPIALHQLGARLARPETAAATARHFEKTLDRLRSEHADAMPALRVFYQVSRRPLYTLGGPHIVSEALAVCGMVNVFESLETAAAVVSREAVIEARPDLIIGADDPASLATDWQSAKLRSLLSVEIRQIDPDLLTRPSLRILEGIEQLCSLRLPAAS